ncbi:hypothetical protein GCK72_023001 [Caenorhabditis remanei]|uniref:N-terminal methionine N(alpha)-acetyltransferase NatE n=1 Tax=Caenorhabditis remanei TaxID=31234 RepID=A0A6A5FVJ9_CAERE|nr:hypothetical protein GCK72_023001 [Caenorhabditis remanei]KAF1746544.1 hypothetical protein GCK72_023001 [Caenorhabditis remanei]
MNNRDNQQVTSNSKIFTDKDAFRETVRESAVVLGQITQDNIKILKTLIDTIFPSDYTTENYEDADSMGEFERIAYCGGKPAGVIVCDADKSDMLYISMIGTLTQYRKCGIGSILLEHAVQLAQKLKKPMSLHVRVDNVNAKSFYEKNGFIVKDFVEEYYKQEPKGAFFLVNNTHVEGEISKIVANREQPGTSARSNSVILREVTKETVSNLKMLMETVFPNMYPDVNFDHAHKLGKFIRIAYINEQPIGLIICRMEKEMLYIALIGVLVEYRRQRVGSALIQHAISFGETIKKHIHLHVQIDNITAQQFYQQHGFIETERDYTYYDEPPRAAFIYTKKFSE